MSLFHLLLQLQFCISMPDLAVFSCACKKSAFKAVLSYSGIKSWHLTVSTRQPMAAHVLCEGKHQGCNGRGELCAWLGLPVPLAGCECWTLPASSSYTTFSFGEMNCGGKALFGDPAGDNREPPWGPTLHENLESLQPCSKCPCATPHIPQFNS